MKKHIFIITTIILLFLNGCNMLSDSKVKIKYNTDCLCTYTWYKGHIIWSKFDYISIENVTDSLICIRKFQAKEQIKLYKNFEKSIKKCK